MATVECFLIASNMAQHHSLYHPVNISTSLNSVPIYLADEGSEMKAVGVQGNMLVWPLALCKTSISLVQADFLTENLISDGATDHWLCNSCLTKLQESEQLKDELIRD